MVSLTRGSPTVHSTSDGLHTRAVFLAIVPDTSVSRSLGASFSELTGMPTPPHMHTTSPSTAALVAVTTQRLPLSVASSDPTTDVLAASQVAPAPAQT